LPGRNLIPTGHARSGHRPRTERTPSISSQPVPPHQSRPVWQTSPDRAPVRESVRTGPRPRRLSSPTLDHAFGGSSTLDSRPWTCWKVSRLATTVSGRRRAPRTTPPPAGFRQPYRAKRRAKNPEFLRAWKQLGKFPRSKARLETEKEMPGGPAAVESASGGFVTPLGLRRDRISSARDPRPALRSDRGYQCPAP
jgi:hypothetical protein